MTPDTVQNEGRFAAALVAIDIVNDADPNRMDTDAGKVARERLYSQRMSRTLSLFEPQASEELRLAVHAQHIERWILPRADYPQGRAGYLGWRTALKQHHAERLGGIMEECGYPAEAVTRAMSLVRKEALKRDADAQTLEDVACLVFLEHYAAEFASGHDDDKVVAIVAKTWRKMSPAGHEAALQLDMPEKLKGLVARALDQSGA